MSWMDLQVSLYRTHSDNTGRAATYRDILLTDFAKDLPALIALRKLDRSAPDYKLQAKPFKALLQAYTPAALLASKAAGNVIELNRTGLMQLDFDYDEIKDYDIRELMQCVFQLPFIAFCGLSCSGYGFYALALIAEPQRLAEYATHCFEILKSYGVNADESKGKKTKNLRYLSYDENMLIRENPEKLQIKHFKAKPAPKKEPAIHSQQNKNKIQQSTGNVFSDAMQWVLYKGVQFVDGQKHNYIFHLCSYLVSKGVKKSNAESWIDSNLMKLTEIKSNCIDYPYANFTPGTSKIN